LAARLLHLVQSNPKISLDKLAALTQKNRSTIMRNISRLKTQGKLKRIGSAKGVHWEVIQ